MKKVLFNYLLVGYLKRILIVLVIIYCFGIILNLFEEVEFFKNLNTSVVIPLVLTALYIPSMIVELLPFIIFVSSMWFLLIIRNNKDLLTLKVFGYSNFKIFFILATTSFLFGWLILFAVNPITSTMMKYYEQTKSRYSLDIDHLVSINKNGLWIKENLDDGYRISTAKKTRNNIINDLTIFMLDKDYNLTEKIFSQTANIKDNTWILNDVMIQKFDKDLAETINLDKMLMDTDYNYEKITSLFRNFNTMSFLDLLLNYNELKSRGYNEFYLNQNLNSQLSMPFFLFIMTALASILTMNALKKSNNFTFIVVGLISCVAIYYFKDLSLALGKTNRIGISLAAWIPVTTIGLFSAIGILQINEK